MNVFDKLKQSGLRECNWFKKENMVILILIGVLCLVVAIPVKSDESKKETKQQENLIDEQEKILSDEEQYIDSLERRLSELLMSMEGVGTVKVMITLQSSKEAVVEKDHPTTRNMRTESGKDGMISNDSEVNSQETTIYTTDDTGNKIPYVTKTKEARIEGITVVAQGGDNAIIQKNISEVIQALFPIELHRIRVVKMR